MQILNIQGMHRNFRLSVHRKNEIRKKARCIVSVEHVSTVQFSSQSTSSSILHSASPSCLHFNQVFLSTDVWVNFCLSLSSCSSVTPQFRPRGGGTNGVCPNQCVLDCKVDSLAKLQDRVNDLSVLANGRRCWISLIPCYIPTLLCRMGRHQCHRCSPNSSYFPY